MNKLAIFLLVGVYSCAFKALFLTFKILWVVTKAIGKFIGKMLKKGWEKRTQKKAFVRSRGVASQQRENNLDRMSIRSNISQDSRLNTRVSQARQQTNQLRTYSGQSLTTGHSR
ncbi:MULTISPECIES: hypothetical protein [Enterococcus]|uniref:hypothetical protein n=1 Tax=Enterococcus TaxID=1350 RepID=UPI0004479F0F|nr:MULTISPECIES: hypothetical protein [Enterococcus]AZP93956.1 hypothetical protein CYK55_13280 [Enterococcus mundtii]EYT95235.1 hypothetical protein AK89_09885 [Enterococcus mundtii CRL35]MDO7880125.1 hypothetical protein [Enterococcus mundtii]